MSSSPNLPRTRGLSLYANLLESAGNTPSASIQRAPVVFNKGGDSMTTQDEGSVQKKLNAGS